MKFNQGITTSKIWCCHPVAMPPIWMPFDQTYRFVLHPLELSKYLLIRSASIGAIKVHALISNTSCKTADRAVACGRPGCSMRRYVLSHTRKRTSIACSKLHQKQWANAKRIGSLPGYPSFIQLHARAAIAKYLDGHYPVRFDYMWTSICFFLLVPAPRAQILNPQIWLLIKFGGAVDHTQGTKANASILSLLIMPRPQSSAANIYSICTSRANL
jgi:hypothetical protein